MGKVYNVLSIDGCGFRGRTQLLVLNQLMTRLGRAAGPRRPSEVFDLICGTATGGLIAILVGRLGMTCDEAIRAYDDLEARIFSGHGTTIQDLLSRPQPFDTAGFQARLAEIVRERHAGQDAQQRFRMDIADDYTRQCRTFVTVVPRDGALDSHAARIRSYPDSHTPRQSEIIPGHIWQIQEAAVATTLCPRLFSPLEITTSSIHSLQAANMSGFSNPSLIAYDEALTLFGNNAKLTLVSLGMGLRNRHNYGALEEDEEVGATQITPDDIDRILGQLGPPGPNRDPQSDRLREFIRQTALVATSTQIKHMRLANLMGREPDQHYHRFDPPRNGRPYILVDYIQTTLVEEVATDSFPNAALPWVATVTSLQRTSTSRWRELPGFKSDAQQVDEWEKDSSNSDPAYIMEKCYEWEKKNDKPGEKNKEYISCFTIGDDHVRIMTGPIKPDDRSDEGRLFVRVLLDDQWRFFPQLKPTGRSSWPHLSELDSDSDSTEPVDDPVRVIRAAQANSSIKAINSQGFYTTGSSVSVEDVKVPDPGFTLPFHGTWVRTNS